MAIGALTGAVRDLASGPWSLRQVMPRGVLARSLAWFWLIALLGLAGLALVLQVLGPPSGPPSGVSLPAAPALPARTAIAAPSGVDRGGARLSPPLPGLQEPVPGRPGAFLPRIGADGRAPMQAYAAPFDPNDRRPRIGVLLAGMGLNGADSAAAIGMLPSGVTFAFSPYADRTASLLDAARQRGQEYLLSLPMEPKGAPLHDAGDQALLVGAPVEQNRRRLEWSLARIGGYVGATGALGALHGERFAASGHPMRDVAQTLAGRGLLYVDPRPGAALPPGIAARAVDVVLDVRQERAEIEHRLRQLERVARDQGSALGLAGAPVPVTVGTVAVWALGLEERGFVLAPVSALMPALDGRPTPAGHPR